MPRRKDDPDDLVTLKVRITPEFKDRCNKVRQVSNIWRPLAETSFIRMLLELGINKYENTILPAELGKDEQPIAANGISITNQNGKMNNVSANTGNITARKVPNKVKILYSDGTVKEYKNTPVVNALIHQSGVEKVIWDGDPDFDKY